MVDWDEYKIEISKRDRGMESELSSELSNKYDYDSRGVFTCGGYHRIDILV